ncbi:MAG: hypothetical protein ACRDZ9_01710 [Acidimicrobiales bacterium]
MFLGENLLPLLVLALGGAMALGTGLALLRPPPGQDGGRPARAPLARSLVMIGVGSLAAIWALATLVTG